MVYCESPGVSKYHLISAKSTQEIGLSSYCISISGVLSVLVGVWQNSTISILFKFIIFIMPEFDKSKFWFHLIPNLEKIPQSRQEKYFEFFLSMKRAVASCI